MLWKLVATPSEMIHSRTGELLLKVNSIVGAIG